MVRRVISVILCFLFLSSTLVVAGGAPMGPAPMPMPPQACAPGAVAGPNPAYWGDAPFPGLCGGVVALPFLVVGSLLGGNSMGAYGMPPRPVSYVPPAGSFRPVAPAYKTIPQACAPVPAPAPCGPGYGAAGGGFLTGLPCFELCSGILSSLGGGMGILY
jgi:hypothetical protein